MTREDRLIDYIAMHLWIGAGCRVGPWEVLPNDVAEHYRAQARNAAIAYRKFEEEHKPGVVK